MSIPQQNAQVDSSEAGGAVAYLRPLWRWKWVILLVAVIGAAGAYAAASRHPKQYVSGTEIYVQATEPAAAVTALVDGQVPAAPQPQDMEDLATLFTQGSLTEAVYRRLGVPLGSAGTVAVTPLLESNGYPSSFLVLAASGTSPVWAARLANAYVATFIKQRREAQAAQAHANVLATQRQLALTPNTTANAQQRQALITEQAQLKTVAQNPSAEARQVNPAPVPAGPVSPRPRKDAIVGGLVGLLLGIAAAFGLELLDKRLNRVASVESTFGVPVLAVLPHVRHPSPKVDGEPVVAPAFVEQMRGLRVHLAALGDGDPPRTILVTSAVPGEGKSTIARALALVYAEAGQRVLIVDADLRRSRMGEFFGVTSASGLVQVLRGEAAVVDVAVGVQQSHNGRGPHSALTARGPLTAECHGRIDLLTYGERIANPVGLLSEADMSRVLDEARASYDVVILDSAPLLAVADTLPTLSVVDAVLLVARLGHTTRESAEQVGTVMHRRGARIVGMVTTDVRSGALLGQGYRSYDYRHDYSAPPPSVNGSK